jgi:hypothetical protein
MRRPPVRAAFVFLGIVDRGAARRNRVRPTICFRHLRPLEGNPSKRYELLVCRGGDRHKSTDGSRRAVSVPWGRILIREGLWNFRFLIVH